MTEDPVGGRVLVVALSGSTGNPESDGSGEPFVRGGGASGTGDNRRDSGDSDGRAAADEGDAGSGGVCGPQEVAAGLAEQLSFDVVLRDERTAPEYLDELGPTLDCVVALGGDAEALGSPVDDGSIPTIVCEGPVVDPPADVAGDAVTVGRIAAGVRAAVCEERSRSGLRDRNARLTALNRYAKNIAGCETVDTVLSRTVEAATDALAFEFCAVLLVDGDRFVPRASALPEPELSPFAVDEGLAGRTLAAGEAEVVADMQSDPDAVVEHDDLHAVLSVPIGSEGVLQIASRDHGAFGDCDRELTEILSGYTTEALARIEREVGLRTERDYLSAFYAELPLPALRAERRESEIVVADANGAYESAFGTAPVGWSIAGTVPTAAERNVYAAALEGERSNESVTRTPDGDGTREYALTAVPRRCPTGPTARSASTSSPDVRLGGIPGRR